MDGQKEATPALHGIQLNYVGLKEMHFDSKRLPSTVAPDQFDDTTFSTATSEYDGDKKTISVVTKVETQTKDDSVHLRVELVSEFRVDETIFPADKVNDWAKRAAFLVLFPFLREHLFSLCTRVGLPPIILPLILVPTYTVSPPVEVSATPCETAAGEK